MLCRHAAIVEPPHIIMLMTNRRSRAGHRKLTYEQCEDRALLTVIFVLNGNAFGATSPSILTANAAQVLERAGDQAVQILPYRPLVRIRRELPESRRG